MARRTQAEAVQATGLRNAFWRREITPAGSTAMGHARMASCMSNNECKLASMTMQAFERDTGEEVPEKHA